MKSKSINFLSFFLCFSIIISLFISSPQSSVSNYTLYTRTTDISLPPVKDPVTILPNHTVFEFGYTLQLINTYGENVYIWTPSSCLIFNTGNITFEDNQHDGIIGGGEYLCFSAFTEHEILPGISEMERKLVISINGSVEALPNGNYSAWIVIDDYANEHDYVNYPSIISVKDSNFTITHTGADVTFTFPSVPTFPKDTVILIAIVLLGSPILFLLKKKRT